MSKLGKLTKLVLVTVLGISAGVGILQTKASAASKTVTFGSTGVSYPSSFKSNGKLKGFDVEVVNKASKRLGYKVKWVNADFDGLLGSLDSGKIDAVANDVAVTTERQQKYAFTTPYSYDPTAVAVSKDSKLKTLKDLEGKTVAAVVASNNIKSLQNYDSKIKIKTYETRDQAYAALNSGKVAGVVNTRPILSAMIKQKKLDWKILKGNATENKVAIAFSKDAKGKKLAKQYSKEIKEMKKDGTLAKLSKKYYGYDTSKN
ncbi:transporter substrate-binding domain-containing protein [Limosilactobacillus fermentum]|uniref:transporter substrate-binding domain-containing protein n=1 Tax=Limosilactobacillus fermentum TaxID=1613 RepID=UPI0022E214C1|nr:transporter substrate-binding domain-containing protein [Limosilactobacillus fermentum]